MDRNKTSHLLKKVLKQHAKDIEPSPHALFAINRRIRESEDPRKAWSRARRIWQPIARVASPAIVLGAFVMLTIGALTGFIIAQNDPPNSSPVQVATPGIEDVATLDTTDAQLNLVATLGGDNDINDVGLDTCANTADEQTASSGSVAVYFVCNQNLVARQRLTNSQTVESALKLLVAGPTLSELQTGITSVMTDSDGSLIESVDVNGSWAVVNFSSQLSSTQLENSTYILKQLNATIFEFPEVQLIEYQVNGSCQDFARTIVDGECSSYTRLGSRPGGGDRQIVIFKQAQVGRRNIFACPSNTSCQQLGKLESTSGNSNLLYRWTGGTRTTQEMTWFELVDPNGQIGWIESSGVSVQLNDLEDNTEITNIVGFITQLPDEPNSAYKRTFSSLGLYGSYVKIVPYGYFHLTDPLDDSAREKFTSVTRILRGATLADELIAPSPLLDNLEYVTLESSDDKINLYFDYRNGYAEILAISVHPNS